MDKIRALSQHALPALKVLLIAAAGFWIYHPVLNGAWLMDDAIYLPHNPLLHDPARLWKIWFAPGSFIEYYPIEETVQWAQWQLWGNQTFGYHLTNVVLHLVNGLLVWRLLDKFGLKLAWLGGLLFVIHPAAVESVAWISELKNTLSLLPFLLAMCAWFDYEERNRPRDYYLALGLFAAAMLCKISMATFPLVILLYAWWKRDRIGWTDLRAFAPFLMISLALVLVTILASMSFTANHHREPGLEQIATESFFQRLVGAGLAFAFYFSQFFWPVRMMPLYPQWNIDSRSLLEFLPWPIVLAGACWLWTKREGWGRHAILGGGFFLILLAPFLGFTTISYMNITPVMDHFLYLPMIGLIGLVVAALERMAEIIPRDLRSTGTGIATAVLVLLALESHGYAGVFVNPETLWTYTVQGNPDSEVAQNNLGLVYLNSGRFPKAIDHYLQALKINPDYATAHNGLGNALAFSGNAAGALDQYRKASRLDPDYPEAHNGLANILLQNGQLPEAKAECEEALRLRPNYTDALCNLGLILAQQGQIPEAIEEFEAAQKLNPTDVRIQQQLSSLRAQLNNGTGKK